MASILIIDDEASNRRLLEILVQAEGHTALTAADGATGIALAITEKPNLILLDWMMPGMDGFEVVQRLRAHPATAALQVVVVSATFGATQRQRIAASGVDASLMKPIDRAELSDCLSAMLQSQK
jgi:two-component system cell cycle response regulator